jgi:hypothetical protein
VMSRVVEEEASRLLKLSKYLVMLKSMFFKLSEFIYRTGGDRNLFPEKFTKFYSFSISVLPLCGLLNVFSLVGTASMSVCLQ